MINQKNIKSCIYLKILKILIFTQEEAALDFWKHTFKIIFF